jgi:acetyl esterase/lipase
MSESRRDFLRKSALLMGTLGISTSNTKGVSGLAPPDPEPEFLNEEMFLWQDGSENNGKNPDYRPKIRIYYPTLRNSKNEDDNNNPGRRHAAVLICPGGGYYVQAPHEGQPFAQLLALYGIVSVVLTYRVFPDRYPGSYSDACRAIRLLRKNADKYDIDPDKIGIMGFSAGGHLASTVATQPDLYKEPEDELAHSISARPDRVILGYPVISFIDDYAHKGSSRSLLGDEPDPAMVRQLSNNHQITKDNPPAFLFHAADDKGVPVYNSLSFAEACMKKGVPVEMHIYPEGGHGMGMALEDHSLKTWTELLINWLRPWCV